MQHYYQYKIRSLKYYKVYASLLLHAIAAANFKARYSFQADLL